MTPEETDPALPVSVQESPAEAWLEDAVLQGLGALRVAACAWDLLKEVTVIFITSAIVCFQGKRQGENTQVITN